MQHMNGNIPYLFDFWDDPFVHLLLLKSSMVKWSAFVPSIHSDDPSSNPDDDKIIFKIATSFSD